MGKDRGEGELFFQPVRALTLTLCHFVGEGPEH